VVRGVRERMVASAVVLLARHGYQGTSFASVIEHSGAPRGSIYHHFPEGKDQLVAAAIDLAAARSIEQLRGWAGLPATQVVDRFLDAWRALLVETRFGVGCSVAGLTVSADSPALVARAGEAFGAWRVALQVVLEAGGIPAAEAPSFATMLLATSEGAVVMCRAERSLAPLADVQLRLHWAAAALVEAGHGEPRV
jgi:TetR/AcrR family transcriptional repressor of lmrAB and yxaGH operons